MGYSLNVMLSNILTHTVHVLIVTVLLINREAYYYLLLLQDRNALTIFCNKYFNMLYEHFVNCHNEETSVKPNIPKGICVS